MDDLVLPPATMMAFRSLRKTAVLMLLFMRFDPKPLGRNLIMRVLDYSEHTAQKYMDDLALHGLILRQGLRDGYVLTQSGKQMILGQNVALPEAPQIVEIPEGANFAPSGTLEEDSLIKESRFLESRDEGANFAPSRKYNLVDVLKLAPVLFDGEHVSATGLTGISADDALAWIIYAYERRDKLNAPCGLIYSRLKKRVDAPDANILMLPDRALRMLGIERPGQLEAEDDEINAASQEEIILPDESVTDDIRAIWAAQLEVLAAEMARAQFENWVKDTLPVRFCGNELLIGARNSYQRDWLIKHLAEMRLVNNPDVTVKFVVGGDYDE